MPLCRSSVSGWSLDQLDRVGAGFASADADNLFDAVYKYLAISNPPGRGGFLDGLDGTLAHLVRSDDFNFHLGQKVDDIFGAPVKLGMALLAAKTLGFRDCDAEDASFLQRFLDLVELEGLMIASIFFMRSGPPEGEFRAVGMSSRERLALLALKLRGRHAENVIFTGKGEACGMPWRQAGW